MRHDTPPGYHIDADDLPTGSLLSRREALTLLGGGQTLVSVTQIPDGYQGTFQIGVQMS